LLAGREEDLVARIPIFATLLLAILSVRAIAQVEPPIATELAKFADETHDPYLSGVSPALLRFYGERQYQPIWTDATGFNAAGRSVLGVLTKADLEGLSPSDYFISPLAATSAQPDGVAASEILLSATVLRFAQDLGWGVTLPAEVDTDNNYEKAFDGYLVLQRLALAPDPGSALLGMAPKSLAYVQLKKALAELRQIRSSGGWSAPSAGPSLRLADINPRVQELRRILVERGDLDAQNATGDTFDVPLEVALKRFQRRLGLEQDGVYGADVVKELNVPISERILQVRLGLERLRWLPDEFTGRRVGVNLADFRVYVLDDDVVTFETRAVVGKQLHETPMFSARMTYMVINPYWNVPTSIAKGELLPKIKRDPNYLTRNHMEMNGSTIRQLPGPWNALGRYKFIFPNVHNVYLHDTPSKALFDRAQRAYSHGCVRVDNPAGLAAVLLAKQGWDPERIASAVDTGVETVVTLDVPIPVHITYITAFMNQAGELHYRHDVYGRDRKLIAALERRGAGSWTQ
jgi:murein L,D-transpeptidase YcbB/YkuD